MYLIGEVRARKGLNYCLPIILTNPHKWQRFLYLGVLPVIVSVENQFSFQMARLEIPSDTCEKNRNILKTTRMLEEKYFQKNVSD